MVGFQGSNDNRRTVEDMLETPRMVGYRNGMSTTRLISERLNRVYGVDGGVPTDMGVAIRNLGDKIDGSR